jgi:ribosomal protein L20
MKTFKQFLDESYAYLEEDSATESKPGTKSELQARIDAALKRNNRKSLMHSAYLSAVKAGRKGRSPDVERRADKLAKSQSPSQSPAKKKAQKHRDENIEISTGELTDRQKDIRKAKIEKAKSRGMDVHHNNDVKTSGDTMRNMSPEERSKYRENQAKEHSYHGDDPRNLVVANNTDKSEFSPHTPGFHHNKYHSFERNNRKKLKDLPISKQRAFTTLVNQARRRKKRAPELQARMSAAAERNNIKD